MNPIAKRIELEQMLGNLLEYRKALKRNFRAGQLTRDQFNVMLATANRDIKLLKAELKLKK